jgi:hypothetical protein
MPLNDSERKAFSAKAAQTAENVISICSVSAPDLKKEPTARDYSPNFQERVCARFMATQSIRQTGRDFSIPARLVGEILHLANFRRPMSVARSSTSGLYGVGDARRSA